MFSKRDEFDEIFMSSPKLDKAVFFLMVIPMAAILFFMAVGDVVSRPFKK